LVRDVTARDFRGVELLPAVAARVFASVFDFAGFAAGTLSGVDIGVLAAPLPVCDVATGSAGALAGGAGSLDFFEALAIYFFLMSASLYAQRKGAQAEIGRNRTCL
jgi:hypothetical protein